MAAPTQEDVNKVLESISIIEKESKYAEAIKMDYQQIEGTRYKYRISEKQPKR